MHSPPRRHRPRLLFVSCHLPFPAISGGRLRELELLKRLGTRFDIGLRAVSKTYDEDLANAHELARYCTSVEVFPALPDPNSATSWQVARHHSPGLTARLSDDLEHGSWDLVHVEGFYLMQSVPRDPRIPLVLGEQNIEFLLCKQRASRATSSRDRAHHLYQYLSTMQAEMEAWERADQCVTVTDRDRDLMLESHPDLQVEVVPDGCDHVATIESGDGGASDGRTLAFIANFAYEPNIDAARFLCAELMPRIRSEVPDVRLLLVGNAPPPDIKQLALEQGAIVTGRVDDISPYLQASDLIVCPLRIGGGIKVKVLEALRAGKPLVTTSIGAQGLDLNGAAVVVDDPRGLAAAVVDLVKNAALRTQLSRAASHYARLLPTWDQAIGKLETCYTRLLQPTDVIAHLAATAPGAHPSRTTAAPALEEIPR